MTREEFIRGLSKLRAAFGKQPIDSSTVSTLFDLTSNIPSPAWPDIVNEAIRLWDSWPKNFPKATKELWYSWLSSHPESQAKHEKSTCFQCHASTGFIWAHSQAPDLPYNPTAVFRCAHCDNAEGATGILRKTRDQITALGYIIDDSGRYQPGDGIVTPITLKAVPARKPQ